MRYSYGDDDNTQARERREVTPQKALSKLTVLCSKAEKCRSDIKMLLTRWEIDAQEQTKILDYLKLNKYFDDERYARAYVRDKSRFSGWGVSKIVIMLRQKGVDADIITDALQEIDVEEMQEKIRQVMSKKIDAAKYKDKYDLRNKMLNFAASKGYGFEEASRIITELIRDKEVK